MKPKLKDVSLVLTPINCSVNLFLLPMFYGFLQFCDIKNLSNFSKKKLNLDLKVTSIHNYPFLLKKLKKY